MLHPVTICLSVVKFMLFNQPLVFFPLFGACLLLKLDVISCKFLEYSA